MKKKSKLIGISLLIGLLLLSSVNISNAAPPSWVGVSAGDRYEWTVTINGDTMIELYEDLLNKTSHWPLITISFDKMRVIKSIL